MKNKNTVRLDESTLKRFLRESVKNTPMENKQIFTIGNQNNDIGHFFKVELGKTFLDSISFNVFGVFSEKEALDAAIDFCEEHKINNVFSDSENTEELPDYYIIAGKNSLAIPSDQVIIAEIS